jgi:hypothetical protein
VLLVLFSIVVSPAAVVLLLLVYSNSSRCCAAAFGNPIEVTVLIHVCAPKFMNDCSSFAIMLHNTIVSTFFALVMLLEFTGYFLV